MFYCKDATQTIAPNGHAQELKKQNDRILALWLTDLFIFPFFFSHKSSSKVVVWTVAWPYFRPIKLLYVLLLSMNRKSYLRLMSILNKIHIFFRTSFCFDLLKLRKWTLYYCYYFFCKEQIDFSFFLIPCLDYLMRNNMAKVSLQILKGSSFIPNKRTDEYKNWNQFVNTVTVVAG